MKIFYKILAFAVISLGIGVIVAQAQNYIPLAPLPIGEGGTTLKTYTFSSYLSGVLKLLIALGAGFSILVAIIGGIQYVAAGIAPSAKNDAKERILNSFIGLALVLSSYLILNSINPKLVQFNYNLSQIEAIPITVTPYVEKVPISTATLREEGAVRDVLAKDSKIIINNIACTTVGQTGCTSVQNLNGRALSGLRLLDEKTCSRRNAIGLLANTCNVVVTGGTEYWLHTTHGDGTVETSTKVDLRKGSVDGIVDNYIKKNGTIPEVPCGLRNAPKYQPDGSTGGTYVDEGDHWHVCY